MCSLFEGKDELMHNWKSVFERSEKITEFLQKQGGVEKSVNWTDDSMSGRIAERLSDSDYLQKKGEEQGRFDVEKAYARFSRRNRRRRIFRVTGIAASIVLCIGCYLLYNVSQQNVVLTNNPQTIIHGEKKAMLYMADGRAVVLNDTIQSKIETLQGVITIEAGGIACTSDSVSSSLDQTVYHEMAIPRGGEYHLQLSDGTRIWLNSETKLRFPQQFKAEDTRMVYLEGEAYFEVEPGSKPFIVGTSLGEIKVLGTAFDIQTYDTNFIATTLVHGKVSYSFQGSRETLLEPGEQLTYNRGSKHPEVRSVNVRLYTSWKDNLFCFEEQSLEQIMQTLARWYDVEVVFESDDLKKLELSGTLDKYSDIGPLLKLFELGTHVKFEINGKIITVRRTK